jgi:hypothetical protein
MGKKARKEYLAAIRGRYRKAGRKEKGAILLEFCPVCDYNRKYAIRILGKKATTAIKKPVPDRFTTRRCLFWGSQN